jgi:hypothetical protein
MPRRATQPRFPGAPAAAPVYWDTLLAALAGPAHAPFAKDYFVVPAAVTHATWPGGA